jgi:hypothetical protein
MLNEDDAKFLTDRQNFDEKTYIELFNAFQLKPTNLDIQNVKSIIEMDDKELLDWVHKLDDFVRIVKVASTSARVALENRKLQLSIEQREALAKLDRQYRPKTVKPENVRKAKTTEPKWIPVTANDKKVAAAMKILRMSKEDAEKWVAEQTNCAEHA